MVIWFTGLSAAGKSTISHALAAVLRPYLPGLVVLEGEDLRNALGNDLGHSTEARLTALARLQGVTKLLSDQGVPMIVACVYMPDEARDWNRANLKGYFDVHLNVSLATVTARDPKGIYRRAQAGDATNVMGVDVPYDPPATASCVIEMDTPELPAILAAQLALDTPTIIERLDENARAAVQKHLTELRARAAT